MKNKAPLNLTNTINIQVIVRMRINELQYKKLEYSKVLGKKAANAAYNNKIKEAVMAYRATQNIKIVSWHHAQKL